MIVCVYSTNYSNHTGICELFCLSQTLVETRDYLYEEIAKLNGKDDGFELRLAKALAQLRQEYDEKIATVREEIEEEYQQQVCQYLLNMLH